MISRMKARSGFTLLELLVVAAIVALLLAIVMPQLTEAQKLMDCRQRLGNLRAAINNFYTWAATDDGGGKARFPTIEGLQIAGKVMTDGVPDNPFSDGEIKNDVVDATGLPKGTIVGKTGAWCYNSSTGEIWPNTATVGENMW